MLVVADPNSSNFKKQLQYPLTIEGIEVTDQTSANTSQPKIVIDLSLDDYTHSAAHTKDERSLQSATGNSYIILEIYLS